MAQFDLFLPPKRPWNTGRIIGPKPPFKPRHIWGIRQQLKANGRVRDLAMFNCAIDAKLRGCDLVKLRVSDVAPGGSLPARATIIQQKTGQPVPFEITEPTRDALAVWLASRSTTRWRCPSRSTSKALTHQIRAARARGAPPDLSSQLRSLPARRNDTLATLDIDGSNLRQKQIDAETSGRYVLVAPTSGTVSSLEARLGDSPSTSNPIATISPDRSPLEAQLFIPTRVAGFLSVGQEARLQIQAFPQAKYGFVHGRVRVIAKSVLRPGEPDVPIELREPVYRVRISIERPYVQDGPRRRALMPGMQLSADIVTDRRPLWRQLFDPIVGTARKVA